jgi:glutamyl-tRNA reductase
MLLLAAFACVAHAQELVLEEIVIEGEFQATLELQQNRAADEFTKRLQLQAETARAVELQKANESLMTKLLDLTRHIPIALQASETRVDTFFQQNYMRADLNPRRDDPLALRD